tara:strand:- start:50 stop:181 length:132 start_codon:yes stop_codon:yes gene_type:complete
MFERDRPALAKLVIVALGWGPVRFRIREKALPTIVSQEFYGET